MTGDIDIYERKTLQIIGTCRAATTVYCEWTPCGKLFATATLCPRMRVGNGYSVYKYTGEQLIHIDVPGNDLYDVQVRFRPGEYQDCPLTPRRIEAIPEKKIYKPPGSSNSFAEKFKAIKNNTGHIQPVNIGKQQPTFNVLKPITLAEDLIPGQAPEPAKKKKRKKKKKGQDSP